MTPKQRILKARKDNLLYTSTERDARFEKEVDAALAMIAAQNLHATKSILEPHEVSA